MAFLLWFTHCWNPIPPPTQGLSCCLPGTWSRQAGPRPECPAQAPGSVEFLGFPSGTYLVLATPAHDQVVPVSVS